jgi:hypothetical protein
MPAAPDTIPAGMEHAEHEKEDQKLPAVPTHNPLGMLYEIL